MAAYLCPALWKASATGTDSKSGTLIHEGSHFTAKDRACGHNDRKDPANNKPAKAIINAYNHEYFAENTPTLS